MLNFNVERLKRKALESELENLRITLENFKTSAQEGPQEFQKGGKSKAPLPVELVPTSKQVVDTPKKTPSSPQDTTPRPRAPGKIHDPSDLDLVKAGPNLVDEEPFLLLSQEVYAEHEAKISLCRFSAEATLIGSVDTEHNLQ